LRRYISRPTLQYYSSYFNQNGRGFPDISAHSLSPNYQVRFAPLFSTTLCLSFLLTLLQIVYGRRLGASGGTSAAAPVWAALAGMLNDARFRAGLPALGFLNPWLYSEGANFLVDITLGQARGCDGINHQTGKTVTGAGVIPGAFWNATAGWDPATGLGIPDFTKMLANVLGEQDSNQNDLDDDDE
jgi:tripeptidyl-peptidase-1